MHLDLFLASLMQDHARLRDRLRQAQVSESQLNDARENARRTGLLRGAPISPKDLIAFLGDPDEAGYGLLLYQLKLWPDHLFEFGVNEARDVFYRGFKLRVPVTLTGDLPTVAAAASRLDIGHHTRAEVTGVLGAPARTLDWAPREEWYYGPIRDDIYLVAEFDFGLLTRIQEQPYFSM